MKKLSTIVALLACLAMPQASKSEPTKGWYTFDATGCMILKECTEGVVKISSHKDLVKYYAKFQMFPKDASEFDQMIEALDKIDVGVYLAHEKYFPPGHRGIYHTVSNDFFLNATLVKRYSTLMSVMRHEGWHAAQDCMAGSIKNSLIAIIYPEESVPQLWRDIAEKSYKDTPSAIPWEAEATWAGKTEGMTLKALKACAEGNMWEVYEPTPLTLKWLKENNFVKSK